MTVYSHPNVSRVPGVFTKLILLEFPPKMPTLWVFLLTTKNGFTPSWSPETTKRPAQLARPTIHAAGGTPPSPI